MAKLSSINRNEKRKRMVKKYAGRYAKLKAMAADQSLDETERLMARLKMAEIPRNANPTRVRNRCETLQDVHAAITANLGCAASSYAIMPIKA
jgi:small subunit ribosomal protein S14